MARYDRIARLDCPDRNGVFPCWTTLRDLQGREREPELGRRARLRFLALRPVRRMLQRGLERLDGGSLDRQIEMIRQELGQLPVRDRERVLLSEYLQEVGGRSPRGVVAATLDVGADAEITGHGYAAEEFYRTGLELAEAHDLTEQRLAALRHLGRLLRDRGDWDAAIQLLERAATLGNAESLEEWARAQDLLASVYGRRGDTAAARRVLDQVRERADAEGSQAVRTIAAAGRCAVELAAGEPDRALEAGMEAIERLDASDEHRIGVLLNMASAFRRLGLWAAAESCYRVVGRWSSWPEHRAEARAEYVAVAAESGDADAFRERRERLLDSRDRSDPRTAALVDLGLGRGSLLIGDHFAAAEHLQAAISTARDADLDIVLREAEELLEAIRRDGGPRLRGETASPSDGSRSIAERVENLSRELTAAGN